MRLILFPAFILLFAFNDAISQRIEDHNKPVEYFIPTPHESNFTLTEGPSFYQQKENWQKIIDSTWGSGLPLEEKLNIYNYYADEMDRNYPCFPNLNFDWDSLRLYYYNQIDSTTSRGRFAAIMGHLSFQFRDVHTRAMDLVVTGTALNPGVPLLVIGGRVDFGHFGAVLTCLPDSTLLVLRAVGNHPLNLEPGDIILGYEEVLWKRIVQELLEAEIPIMGYWGGSESAYYDSKMIPAGQNWHLFETIDIKKYSTGEIVSLPTSEMLSLMMEEELLLNNEQLAIPGISFPDFHPTPYDYDMQTVSYGLLPNSNVGVIYVFGESQLTSNQEFYEAVNTLKDSDGLIIDMRYNLGGWAVFDKAFNILFNSSILTVENVVRSSANNWNLTNVGNTLDYDIPASYGSFYEKPIAVLVGPSCVSMGDINSYRLGYHSNVKFFGKPTNASVSLSFIKTQFAEWYLRYARADLQHVSKPGYYLNQKEFPVDFPVWFNPDDVASGYDTVLEEAKEYINNLTHTFNVMIDKTYSNDEIIISADIQNPNSHDLSVTAQITSNNDNVDSIYCYVQEAKINESIIISTYREDFYSISIITEDHEDSTIHTLPDIQRFTTAGPIEIESFNIVKVSDSFIGLADFELRNNGLEKTIENISAELITIDSNVTGFNINSNEFGTLGPGESRIEPTAFSFYIDTTASIFNLELEISSDGFVYWTYPIIVDITTSIENDLNKIPGEYSLQQNFPNPFNPTTVINYSIPTESEVLLKVYDVIGNELTTLVNDFKHPGNYEVKWDASGQASGIYFYSIIAGEFTDSKKMLLLK